jgi:hypothetical protein
MCPIITRQIHQDLCQTPVYEWATFYKYFFQKNLN